MKASYTLKENISTPKSAYPTMYRDFDASMGSIDDMEGDISNMTRDTPMILHTDSFASDDSSFDDMLGRRQSEPPSPLSSRKPSLQSTNAPRGHHFLLKQSRAPVYLSYPATSDSDSAHIDNYGRVEYELSTKERAMLVILPNSRGLSTNNKKLADAYSTRTGCVTALLDIYFDDPLPDVPIDDSNDQSVGFIARFKSLTVDLAASVKRNYWLQSHSVFGAFDETDKRYLTTTEWVAVKESIDELLKSHSVQSTVIMGFSFGANAAARVAIEGTSSGEEDDQADNVIKGVVLVHPIYMPTEVCSVVKLPTYLIMGKEDTFYSKDDLHRLETDLKARNDRYNFRYLQMKTSGDNPHGFAIAGDYPPMKLGDLPSKTCQKITKWVLERI